MAKIAAALAALFLFFAFSYARTPSDLPENDIINLDLTSEAKPALLPPSQKQESDETTTASFAEIEPENTDFNAKTAGATADLPESNSKYVKLKIVRFRPINRHFPVSRFGSLRMPLPCGGHGHDMKKPNTKPPRLLSYGDDMILAGNGREEFDPAAVHGNLRQIPERWIRFHHRHHHHNYHENEEIPRIAFVKQHRNMFAKQRFNTVSRGGRDAGNMEKERSEREDGGILRSFRKFLNNHF